MAYHIVPGKSVYATAAEGFKAGGFNAASPPWATRRYGEEHSWNYEAGIKTSWLADRLSLDGAAFLIDWSDLQVNVPNPLVPAQFYIASVGGARSKGVELELHARVLPRLEMFGTFGYTDAHFASGAQSGGANVGGNKLSITPDYTASFGVEPSVALGGDASVYGRAELALIGAFEYDDANTAGQSAYSLANFRAGAQTQTHVRRSLGPERLRYALCADRVCVPGPCPIRVRRRTGPAPDVRRQDRADLLVACLG